MVIGKKIIKGRRNPYNRLNKIPYDILLNKSILDLGCNNGGMLYPIADKISLGIGYDGDETSIEEARVLTKEQGFENLEFHVMDFEKDELIFPQTDIVFMFSISNWVKTWKKIIEILKPNILFFEAHGSRMEKQERFLEEKFETIELLLAEKEGKAFRKLFLCKNYRNE